MSLLQELAARSELVQPRSSASKSPAEVQGCAFSKQATAPRATGNHAWPKRPLARASACENRTEEQEKDVLTDLGTGRGRSQSLRPKTFLRHSSRSQLGLQVRQRSVLSPRESAVRVLRSRTEKKEGGARLSPLLTFFFFFRRADPQLPPTDGGFGVLTGQSEAARQRPSLACARRSLTGFLRASRRTTLGSANKQHFPSSPAPGTLHSHSQKKWGVVRRDFYTRGG